MCAADPVFKENLVTTVEDLLGMNVVPVFNENDAISKGAVKSTVSCTNYSIYCYYVMLFSLHKLTLVYRRLA